MNFKSNNTFNPEKIKNLLIRSANWIGDAVMTTPAIRAIRKNFPNARINLLSKPWVAPVFENSPYIDQIIPYNYAGALRTVKAAKMLEMYNFDAVFYFKMLLKPRGWLIWPKYRSGSVMIQIYEKCF
jgi:heptosyltransferase II